MENKKSYAKLILPICLCVLSYFCMARGLEIKEALLVEASTIYLLWAALELFKWL